jgi:hypothetical protein
VAPTARGEELTIDEFERIATALREASPGAAGIVSLEG